MYGTATIETFHAQLTSTDASPLLEALRRLMTADKDEILSRIQTAASWSGWPW